MDASKKQTLQDNQSSDFAIHLQLGYHPNLETPSLHIAKACRQTKVKSVILLRPGSHAPLPPSLSMDGGGDPERQQALEQYKNKLLESREWETKLKDLRLDIKGLQKDFDKTEENIKALQSVGQIIGEVLKQLDDERCEFAPPRGCPREMWRNPPLPRFSTMEC